MEEDGFGSKKTLNCNHKDPTFSAQVSLEKSNDATSSVWLLDIGFLTDFAPERGVRISEPLERGKNPGDTFLRKTNAALAIWIPAG